ncbi:MAG TPA: hypothetical protein VGE98_04720 [Thermoanaerobaculia bacterium]
MIPEVRRAFNAAWSEEKYQAVQAFLAAAVGYPPDFRICETPIFLPERLTGELVAASSDILATLRSAAYQQAAACAIPAGFAVPDESPHPTFLQIDFALAQGDDGAVVPRLIELQGFPSLYGFQWLLDRAYRASYAIDPSFTTYFGDLDEQSYIDVLRRVIVGDADPETVVLLEIEPEKQKTRIDFTVTERELGVRAVAVTDVIERGGRLSYRAPGPSGMREVPIRRLYNRVIFDEAERKGVPLDLFRRPLDVAWVGHPNWFWKISKFSLPFLKGPCCPEAAFVSDLAEIPPDLENYVLKPLYSFAGLGVEVNVTAERLSALERPESYILQRKVTYAPAIETPDVPAKAEVRMMFVWEDEPVLINNLVRTTKGAMVGVDFNKDKTWIGASVAYHR